MSCDLAQGGRDEDAELWAWRKKSIDGRDRAQERLYRSTDDAGEEKARWNFVRRLADKVDRADLQRDRKRSGDRDAGNRARRGQKRHEPTDCHRSPQTA